MKILVTGANGFLGSWIVRALCAQKYDVRVLHRTTSDMSALKDLKYEPALGDVTEIESLKLACRGVEAVFHAAGVIGYSADQKILMEKVNVGGTLKVIDACLAEGVRRLVHTSSVVAIGASFTKRVLDEKSPFEPSLREFGYYDTKNRAEKCVADAVQQRGLDAVIVNPSIMFGAGDATKSSRKTHMKVAAGKFPFYPPGGVNIMHVADAVEGHIQALAKGRKGERYILGGQNVSVHELFRLLAEKGGSKPPVIPLPAAAIRTAFRATNLLSSMGVKTGQMDSAYTATMYHWYDTTKAAQELGFKARPAADAIQESVTWARAHGYMPTT